MLEDFISELMKNVARIYFCSGESDYLYVPAALA
jgi:hypothetical protein